MEADNSLNSIKKDFSKRVIELTRLIPKGRVTTYGSIAKALGSGRSSRMVGWALNGSHSFKNVPAHRVVNRKGILTGKIHFNPPESMQQQLEQEGVEIIDNQVVNFKEVYWNPLTELEMD